MTTRLLLADDHALLRAGLRSLLESQPDLCVVAEAANGREALVQVREHRPDVAIMDLAMPELNGVEATALILEAFPQTRVLALSMHSEPLFVERALKAGARGYVLKDCAFGELVQAVREVVSGRIYLCSTITGVVVRDYVRQLEEEPPQLERVLTSREREVLQLVAEGHTTKAIAQALCISPKTADYHRSQIMQKLGIRDVAGLTRYAIKVGLTPL